MTPQVAAIILANDIAEAIFPDNSFIRKAINDDAFIMGKKVQLPQSGALPNVTKNRTAYPITVAQRGDTLVEYDIDEYSTDATHLQYTEGLVAPYNKASSIIRDHTEQLNTRLTESVAFNWSPTAAGNIVRTSGIDRPAIAPGATGTRKKIKREDIIGLRRLMDKADIPQQGRCLLVNAEMFNDLLEDTNLLTMFLMGQALQATAELSKLFGFEVNMRSSALRYSTALAPKDFGAANVATDNAGCLAWHPSFVRSAVGGVKAFITPEQAVYQGDLFSALALVGSKWRYTDGRGVYALVETA